MSGKEKKLEQSKNKQYYNYLLTKYKELKLINKIDNLTDKYLSEKKLIIKSLKIISNFFKCNFVAFQGFLGGSVNFENKILKASNFNIQKLSDYDKSYYYYSNDKNIDENSEITLASKEILQKFLNEPFKNVLVNEVNSELNKQGIKNYVLFPVVINSEIIGAFFLANRSCNFSNKTVHYLNVICKQLDNGILHAKLFENYKKACKSLSDKEAEIKALYEMSLSLSLGYDFETLAHKILSSVVSLINVDRISIMIYDKNTNELKTIFVLGETQRIKLVTLTLGKGIAGLALLSRKPIYAPNGCEDERFVPFEFPNFKPKRIFALYCVPLLAGDKPLGVVNYSILSKKKKFIEKDFETMNVSANILCLALQRHEFYKISIKDELTELYTYRYFKDRLQEEFIRAKRYNTIFSLIIFDLDHFKNINDTYGHPFGNIVLQSVSKILQGNIRNGIDIPARFGGEELAIILPHTSEQGAFVLAERIRQKVEEMQLSFENTPVKITISGGISCYPSHGDTLELILEAADNALYKAKKSGRNKIIVFNQVLD